MASSLLSRCCLLLLLLLSSAAFLHVQAQTQVGLCFTAYSEVLGENSTATSWSSIISATLTLNTSVALSSASLPAASSVTAITGSRSVASSDGLGRIVSSATVSLQPVSACTSCDDILYYKAPGGNVVDQLGLAMALSVLQQDSNGCRTQSIVLKMGNVTVCDNDALVSYYNTLVLYDPTVSPVPSCNPPVTTTPPYVCGIGPYNFSQLATLPDVQGSFGGYTLYIRLCGAVSQPDCVRVYGQNVEICQWGSSSSLYVEAYSNSPVGETRFSYANGVDATLGINFTISDGLFCSVTNYTGPRLAQGTILCGASNTLINYWELPSCHYHFVMTSPFACLAQQNFGFCAVMSTSGSPLVLGYNNWYVVASGVLTTTAVQAASLDTAANLYQNPTYLVTGLSNGQISFSALGLSAAASSNNNGTTAVTVSMTLLSPNGYGGNDNIVYWTGGSTPYLWTDGYGLSFGYTLNGVWTAGRLWYNVVSGVLETTAIAASNGYQDNNTVSQGLYASVTYTQLAPGSTTVPSCPTPVYAAATQAAGTVQQFYYCYVSYTTNVYDEYTSSAYWASTVSGTLTAISTATAGQYQVTSLTGTRLVTANDGSYSIAGTTTVSLNTAQTSFVYWNSPLYPNGTTTDSNGLSLSLNYYQQDPTGCWGNVVTIAGLTITCANGAFTNIANTLTLTPVTAGSTQPSCTPFTYQTTPYTCGIGPFLFNSLAAGPDLSLTQNGYTIYLRMCGAVSQVDCVRTFGLNSMVCQWGSSTNLYEISANLSPYGTPVFSYINGLDSGSGIQMIAQDGQSCNSEHLYPRQLNLTILCGISNQLLSYAEGDTCHYYITMLSPLACPTAPPVVTGTSYCGIGNYNFTLLAYAQDMVAQFVGQSIWVRLCGAVRQPSCVSALGYNVQVCQFQNSGGIYAIAQTTTTTGQVVFSYANGVNGNAGIIYNISDGQVCGTLGPRKAQGLISCGPNNALLSFFESPTCTYNMNLQTPLACSGGVGTGGQSLIPSVTTTQTFAFCIINYASNIVPGYTLWTSSITGTLTATSSGAPVYLVTSVTGTRTVASLSLSGAVGSTASVLGLSAPGSSCLGQCDNYIFYTPTNSYVYLDGQGLTLQLSSNQSDPTGCTGSLININYASTTCAASAAAASTITVSSQSITLTPIATGGSNTLSCQPTSTSSPTLTVPTQPTCGIGSFNFAPLATYGDLSVTMNGWTAYARLCGAVSQPDCVNAFGANSQFCQWGSSSDVNEMATLVSPTGETTFSYANGVNGNAGIAYYIRDGATCTYNSVTFPRSVQGLITCGASNALTYYNELSNFYGISGLECQYIVNITTPLACVTSNTYSMCYITYSNVVAEFAYQSYWSAIISATFTIAQALPATGVSSALITAFNGTRSVASADGLGRVVSSTGLTLVSATNCVQGCDQLFYWPPPSGGPFDNAGLTLALGIPQLDTSGCDTTTVTLKANNAVVCDNGVEFVGGNFYPTVDVYPLVSGYAPPACVPPVQNSQPYNCSIGPYNFSPLSSLPDLYGSFGGYTLYMKICGAVTQPDCVRLYGQNVQVCQWGSSTNLYVEAYNNSPQGTMTWAYVNGVNGSAGLQFTIQDGQFCGSDGPRQVIGTITCGTSNAIVSYAESPTCHYNFGITSPLACPLVQLFSFCAIVSSSSAITYNNWYQVYSGIMNASTATPASQDAAVNLYSAPTYVVNNIIAGQVQLSALGMPGSTATSNNNGAVAATVGLSLLAANAYGGNDNWVYYLGGGSQQLLWTDSAGLSWQYTVSTTQVQGNLYSLNNYGDSTGASGYATVTYTMLPAGSTTPVACQVPQYASNSGAAGSQVIFSFCYISYASNIFDEYANTVYWASITSGSLVTVSTSAQGQYLVNSLTGTRTTSTSDGTYTIASTSAVSLAPGYTSYVYYGSPLVANGSAVDSNGLALGVQSPTTDPTGCSGSPVIIQGTNQQCPNLNTSNVYNTLTIAPPASNLQCSPIVYQSQTYTCGIGPYSFSSLRSGPDLNVTMNGYTIFFRMCGGVSQSDCLRLFGMNAMICQWSAPTNLYEISAALSPFGSPTFSYINGVDATSGVSMIIVDGQQCNSARLYPRQSNITILCGQSNQLVSYYEGDTCHYYLTLLTPLVCPSPPVIETGTSYCGIGNYNFTLLAYSNDVVGEFVGQSIWVRLCGAVRQAACVSVFGYTTMVCQYQNGGGTYSLATTNAVSGQVQFAYANGVDGTQGIAFSISNGEVCGSLGPRKSVGYLVCGSVNSLVSFFESPTCTYNMNITTPLACAPGVGASTYSLLPASSASSQTFGFCLISSATNLVPGYTVFASLATGTLVATSAVSPIWTVQSISGYRTVSGSLSGSSLSNASITGLTPLSGCNGCDNVIYYNPNTPAAAPYFDASGLSFALSSSQSDITGCVGSALTIGYNQVSCSSSGNINAQYTLALQALSAGQSIACSIPQYSPALALQPQPTCGIGGVSFAPLATYGDLSVTMNGWTAYARLCGAVSQPDCVRAFGTNVQFCQWGSSSSVNEMATLQSNAGETTFGYVNGVDGTLGYTYYVSDGVTCTYNSVTFPRSVRGTITCGSVNNLTFYGELSGLTGNASLECHYIVNMTTPLACSGGGGGSSSSLSGGAIAGIVIGSVVGAGLILCIVIVFCCGLAGGKRGNKQPEHSTVGAPGKFERAEESQTAPSQLGGDDDGTGSAHAVEMQRVS